MFNVCGGGHCLSSMPHKTGCFPKDIFKWLYQFIILETYLQLLGLCGTWFGNIQLKIRKTSSVRVSPVALQLRSEMDPCWRDLTNILFSHLVSDSFGPVLGARAWSCKTASNYLGLSWLRNASETFGERCFRLPPGLLMFYITFLLYGLMGLTILDHIYSSFL